MPPFPCSYPSPLFALAALALLTGCPSGPYTNTTSASGTTTGTTTEGPTGPTGSTTEPVDPTERPQPTSTTTTGTTADLTTGTTADSTTGAPGTTDADTSDTTTDTTGPVDRGKMSEWGHACTNDEECMALVGDKGVCQTDVLGLYALPGGYCTKGCELPPMTAYVEDDPICGPGVTCIGLMGYFETCTVECTDDSECPREGYECRLLPEIGVPGDPTFCLMTDEHKL